VPTDQPCLAHEGGVSLSLPLSLTGESGSELMFVWCEVELPHHVNHKLV
jgi:hypothetical protein